MNSGKKFERFDSVLRIEALIKSALLGAVFGAGVGFVLSTVFWFLNASGILAAVLAFVLTTAALTVVFYKTVYSPTSKTNARRLDRYGLDERLVTMVELEGDDSYIAQMQRQDAVENLARLDKKQVKLKFVRLVVILASVLVFLFAGMFTVEVLSESGVLPSGSEVWQMIFPPEPPEQYELTYAKPKNGYFITEDGTTTEAITQSVTEGEDASPVLAVANDGYMFLAWSDGVLTPYRIDKDVEKDLTISAIFIEVKDEEDPGDDEDEPDDVPGEGMGSGDKNEPGGGGGKYEEVNQVIDGETYYRDIYEHYYEYLLQVLEERDDISGELRDIIESYFNIIK